MKNVVAPDLFQPIVFQRGNYFPRGATGGFREGEGKGANSTNAQVGGGVRTQQQGPSKGSQSRVYDHHIVMCARLPLSFHFITDNSIQKPFVKTVTVPGRIPVLRECT